jgi:alkaline phosphatase D
MGIEDYRYLHRTYRSDAFLQAALSTHTLVQTWDDHEIVNNRYWNYSEERPYAGDGDHPKNDDAEFMTQLFADGIRAWWEYTPTRVPYDPEAETLLDQLELWRSFQFGDLVELLVTDERLFRTSPTDGSQLGAEIDDGEETTELDETMLGETQRDWFTDRLADPTATWTAWANEVLAMEFDLDLGSIDILNGDAWDGFAAEREHILDSVAESDASFVALTGDMHSALAGYVERDGEPVGQVDLPVEAVPTAGRSVDSVFSLVRTDERFELTYRADETTARAESAQTRFDRLAQRPPADDENDD